MSHKAELLSLPEVQRRIGFVGDREGRRLRRLIEARERALGREILVRSRRNKLQRVQVTISALERWVPELFASKIATLRRDLSSYLRQIDQRIDARARKVILKDVDPQLRALRQGQESLAEGLTDLAARVANMAGADSP